MPVFLTNLGSQQLEAVQKSMHLGCCVGADSGLLNETSLHVEKSRVSVAIRDTFGVFLILIRL